MCSNFMVDKVSAKSRESTEGQGVSCGWVERLRLTEGGQPYLMHGELGQHVVLSLPQDTRSRHTQSA